MAKTLDEIVDGLTRQCNKPGEHITAQEAKRQIIAWAISRLPEKQYSRAWHNGHQYENEENKGWNDCITESERRLRSEA